MLLNEKPIDCCRLSCFPAFSFRVMASSISGMGVSLDPRTKHFDLRSHYAPTATRLTIFRLSDKSLSFSSLFMVSYNNYGL